MYTVDFHSAGGVGLRPHFPSRFRTREFIRTLAVLGTASADLMLLCVASGVAGYMRFGDFARTEGAALLFMIVPAYLLASITYRSYSLDTLKLGARSVSRANLALITAAGFGFSAAFALHVSNQLSRLETGYMLLVAGMLLAVFRLSVSAWLAYLRPAIEPSTFVLGDDTSLQYGETATRVLNVRRLNWIPAAEDPDFLDLICRTFRHADRVVLVFSDYNERIAWAAFMRLTGINAELLEPQLMNVVPTGIGQWAGTPTLIVCRGPLSLPERVVKRSLDLTLTILLAPAVIPIVALLAILVKFDSPGPCLFAQDRVGRNNGRYCCYKLRTMYFDKLDPNGDRSAARFDDRTTRVGRFLRRTSLDELPQLWNVFVGNMSFVGPRPHALGSKAEGKYFWEAVHCYWSRHAMKPGLTGLAQVRGLRGSTQSRHDIEQRVLADLEYLNSWSIWLDIKILFRTPLVMVHKKAF